MRTLTIFNYYIGFELWCPWTDFKNWQLGAEIDFYENHKAALPPCRLYWFGPFHVAVSKSTRETLGREM